MAVRFLGAAGAALALMLSACTTSPEHDQRSARLQAPQETLARPKPSEPALVDPVALRCLGRAAYFEARGEGKRGMQAVVHVVLNRVASRKFPNDVCGVVHQGGPAGPCQFSWYCDGKSDIPQNAKSWARAELIAQNALLGKSADPTKGATMFHATSVRPYWASKSERTAQIGSHIFYTLN